jgi:multiple sugar transport system permease protein
VYYIPVITSWVVVSYLFQFLFSGGSNGIINYLLMHVFHLISEPIGWLQNTWTANLAIWILSIWKGIGWVMVMYLAALMSIPRTLYEAAEMDGAKGTRMFIYITLPLMKPMTAYVLINLINGAFTAFLQVYFLTNGGPLGTTEVMNTYLFRHAFSFFQFGYGSAVGVIIGIFIFLITYNQQRKFGKERIEF